MFFPLGELDKPLKYFVSVELNKIYKTDIDTFVCFSTQIRLFEYPVEGFNVHICIDSISFSVEISPVLNVGIPLFFKIFEKHLGLGAISQPFHNCL